MLIVVPGLKKVSPGDDDLQCILTIRRWGLVGVHVEIVIDELAECIGVWRQCAPRSA
jgi:hypothetical protein